MSPPQHDDARTSRPLFLVFAGGCLALDLWSKSLAFAHHALYQGDYENAPLLLLRVAGVEVELVRAYNRGIVFGLLEGVPWATPLLVGARVAILACLSVLLRRTARRAPLLHAAMGALAGGALGNLWDNLFQDHPLHPHAVRDFLAIGTGSGRLPVLNLADICVTIGGATAIVLLSRRRLRRASSPS